MEPWLPPSGNTHIGKVREALQGAERLLGPESAIRVRCVLIEADGTWLNVTCLGKLVPQLGAVDMTRFSADVRLGPIRLLEWWGDPSALTRDDDLRLLLARWRDQPGVSSGYQFEPHANVRRYGSGTAPWTDSPFWWVELHESVPGRTQAGVPQGPFYEDEHRLFAESVGELAAIWLGDGRYRQKDQADNGYHVAIPDRRGTIRQFRAEGNALKVLVEHASDLTLRCVATRTGFRGDTEILITDVKEERADFTFGGGVQELRVWLITPSGQWLDEYHESAAFASWGHRASIYSRPRADTDEPYGALLQRLQDGESDTTEFKAWIPPHRRDHKADELLKTVCAFANTKGGTVYIGVTDHAEVVGTGKELKRNYRGSPADVAEQRDRYVKDLRRILSEGIRPSLGVHYEWVGVADHHVLQIQVSKSPEPPYALVESGDIYVRAGATSRKARPDEYAATGAGRYPAIGVPRLRR